VMTGPVIKIMPKLLELCGGVSTPPFVEEVRPNSHESSDMYSPLCQALCFEKCGDVDAVVSLLHESTRKVVSVSDRVAKSWMLPTVPRAVAIREVCDFFATLVVYLLSFRNWLTGASPLNMAVCLFRRGVGVSCSSAC
jgi:hypothetical protein